MASWWDTSSAISEVGNQQGPHERTTLHVFTLTTVREAEILREKFVTKMASNCWLDFKKINIVVVNNW